MLDLEARVHLQEPGLVLPLLVDELHRAKTVIGDRPGERDAVREQRGANAVGQVRRRRLFDQLLMVALNRAIALEEMDDVSMAVSRDLHLEMARPQEQLLEQQRGIAEGRLDLSPREVERGREIAARHDAPHASAPAAGGGLDHHWIADALGLGREPGARLIVSGIAGNAGEARLRGDRLGADLRSHHPYPVGRRADEDHAGLGA